MIFRKYEFDTKAEAQIKIDALGEHKHSIVHLGNITLQQGEYDVDGNEITAPVISDKYHIDVLWSDTAPTDWQPFEVWCKPVGMHVFANSQVVEEWTAKCKELHPEYFPGPEIEL